jgi:hypothetical protein
MGLDCVLQINPSLELRTWDKQGVDLLCAKWQRMSFKDNFIVKHLLVALWQFLTFMSCKKGTTDMWFALIFHNFYWYFDTMTAGAFRAV